MVAHVSVPVVRTHSPYIERKDLRLQVRTGLAALVAALLLCGGLAIAWAVLPAAAVETRAAAVKWATDKPSTAGWQYPRPTPSYDSMYAPGAETRSLDSMYAKPRARRFDR